MDVQTTAKVATIAVVDEKVWRVRHLSEVLQAKGHRVLLLTSASNALNLLSDGKCDVVLTVENMVGLSGSALCTSLRERLGARRPWLVLLMAEDVAISSATRAIFDVCVPFPVDDARLLEITAEAVAVRRALVDATVIADAEAAALASE